MSATLRVLFVEDSNDDHMLLVRALESGGFSVTSTRVENESDMREELTPGRWDLVVSDYSMPCFSALGALAVFKQTSLDIPFIVASGTVGEETAVEVLKAGAHDFVVKDHLARFVPAVRRELREAALRGGKREAERAMREMELRFRRIVETAQEGIWLVGPGRRTTYINERMAQMLGATPEQLYGVPLLDLIGEDWKGQVRAKLEQAGVPETSAQRIECKLRRLDGSSLWGSLAVNAIDDDSGRHMGHLAMVVDVTDQRKLQEQLIVSDRMASVGTLAAGVAHEINNPLAVILANLHLATEEIAKLVARFDPSAETADLNEEMHDAQQAAERVRNIVRDLKIFSRVQEPQTEPVEVKSVLESSLRMAWNEIRHRARIVRDYQDVPPVEGSDSRLGQVFLNLITNAAHAMEEGHADRNELSLTTRQNELGRVVVEIGDSGAGMSPEVQRRIFTPFFTTKPAGVGTGLGLSICRQIVHSLNGEITVESVLGKGSVFRVVLPRAKAALVPAPQPIARPMAAPRRARILVVDDEAVVGNTVCRLLAKEHEVSYVTNAQQVVDQLSNGVRYDIILCDLMMPEITGMDLFATVQKLAPEQAQRMIFMTGGAFTHKAREFLAHVTNPHVDKPFEPAGLKHLVNTRLLSSSPA